MKEFFSSRDVANLISVDPSSVNRWIDGGQLTAFRTPGGHRRVRRVDLLRFLEEFKMPVPDDLKAQRRKIFIVDDDKVFLRAFKRALLRADKSLEIETCDSGIEALIRIGAACPDVVLLDVHMPGIDGVEVCERLKGSDTTREIMIIGITGRTAKAIQQRMMDAGADAFLRKPFKPAQVLEVVTSAAATSKRR